MKIKFTDSLNNSLDLSALNDADGYAPRVDFGDFETKVKVLDKFGVEGGYETGDGVLGSRNAEVKIWFIAQTDLAYRQRLARVVNFFRAEKRPFYLVDTDNNLRAKVSFKGMSWKAREGSTHRIGEGTIKLAMLDALMESTSTVTITSANIASGSSMYIVVSSNIEVYNAYPQIKMTTAGANADFSITNVTNGDSVRIQQVNLTSGQFVQVDSVDGLIYYGTTLSPTSKTGGNFPRLVNGLNQIQYQSAIGTAATSIEIIYRPRFVI
jgi:hypothetical protein